MRTYSLGRPKAGPWRGGEIDVRLPEESLLSERVWIALVRVIDTVIDESNRRFGSFAAHATLHRLCLDIRREYPDFPEPDVILNVPVPTGEQGSTAMTDPAERASAALRRELQALQDETDAPERNVALLSALAQFYCDATLILVSRPDETR